MIDMLIRLCAKLNKSKSTENLALELGLLLEADGKRIQEQNEHIHLLIKEKEEAELLLSEANRRKMMQEEVDRLYVPGEKEAIENNEFKIFTLLPSRQYSNSASDFHFRVAESQFLRAMGKMASNYHVTKVDYIVNPPLIRAFEKKRLELAQHMDWEQTKPILCFHGTRAANISNIIKNNFDTKFVGSSTDSGFYGAGICKLHRQTIH